MSFIFLRVTGGAAFSPASLFASGEQGAWYEPSPTTCFTDTAGTTAAGVGDAVARINDSSGNGNHATQGTAAARPLLQQTAGGLYYLDFDGTDDGMATAAIDFTGTDKMSLFAGLENEGSGSVQVLCELGSGSGTQQAFAAASRYTADNRVAWLNYSNPTATAAAYFVIDAAPVTYVGTYSVDRSGTGSALNEIAFRRDGVAVSGIQDGASSNSTGNYGNLALNIGARNNAASLWFNGKLFSLIVRGAASTAQEISDTESYVANLSGVTL